MRIVENAKYVEPQQEDFMARSKKRYQPPLLRTFYRYRWILLLLVSLLATGGGALLKGKVVSVHDGDTLTLFDNDLAFTKIRLYGVDTPESRQTGGQAATNALRSLILFQQVEVTVVDKDRYGRSVALVALADKKDTKGDPLLVNEELVRQGHAWVYGQYCKQPRCREWKRLESRAREQRLGLWRDNNPIPPWRWRQNHR